jgi:hypothetical protein
VAQSYTDREREVLLAFIDWHVHDAEAILDKARKHMAAGKGAKSARINPQLFSELSFWQGLRKKFEQ